MKIFTLENQIELLKIVGVNRITRKKLATDLNISIPTASKILNDPAPLALHENIYNALDEFMKAHTVVATTERKK